MSFADSGREQILDTIEGTARRLGVGRSMVYELIKEGELETVKIGRCRRIPVDSISALVQRRRTAA